MKRTIKMLVKRTQYQEIIIDPEKYDVPEDIEGFVEFCEWTKRDYLEIADNEGRWETEDDSSIESFNIEENEQ